MVRFDRIEPEDGTLLRSSEVRDNFQALERANELRPVPGVEVDPGEPLKMYVEAGNYATNGQSTSTFAGGLSADFVAPGANPRIDVLYISLGGSLLIQQGVENLSPVPPPYPADATPIAEITLPVGVTDLSDATVTIKDVRPLYVISAAGFGINPVEEILTATSGQTIFTLTTFTYATGQNELNVFVDGVRQETPGDYTESGTNELTFPGGLQENAKVIVWKVGAASAHSLADLDDVDVATAEAVTDPLGNRTNVADQNNPFATLTDVAGAVPFAAEHDGVTGEHGPTVNIIQPGNDNALVIDKQGVGSGSAINITNDGIAPSILIAQDGDGIALDINKTAGSARVITIDNTGTGAALSITQDGAVDAVQITQNAAGDGLLITNNDAGNCMELVNNGSAAAMVVTQNTAENAVQVSKTNVGAGILLSMTNNGTGSAIDVTQNGSGVALSVTKTGTGRSINISHNNATEAVNIENAGAGVALRVGGLSNDVEIIGIGVIDALWNGGNADVFHTHGSIPTVLSDLSDVSADEAAAINSANAPDGTNTFATLNDLTLTKVGSYVGDGPGQSIAVGFQPDWVQLYNDDDNTQSGVYVARAGNGRFFQSAGTPDITITATGFDVNNATGPLNATGETYRYIAWKGNS